MKTWRRRLLATSYVSVYDLVFQYSNSSWKDGYYTDDGGVEYRLLEFYADGTLTFDPSMLNRFSFDMWVIAAGGKGGDGTSDNNYRTTTWSSLDGSGLVHPENCGGSIARISDGSRGGTGGNGGWSQVNSYITSFETAVINSGRGNNDIKINDSVILSANAGSDAKGTSNGSSGSRSGEKWFETSYGNGGSGGNGKSHYKCDCGASKYNSGGSGSIGNSGVVYIRIPTDQ